MADSSVSSGSKAGQLDGIRLRFSETMSGYLGIGENDPVAGFDAGKTRETPARFDVEILISDLGLFLRDPRHAAALTGSFTFTPLGGTFSIHDGRFNLFPIDAATGERRMLYEFSFDTAAGQTYRLVGHKEVRDDKRVDVFEDMTLLFTRVYRGNAESGEVYGAGQLRFDFGDTAALVASMKVEGAGSFWQELAARTAFASFAWGALRDEYLKDASLFYDTQYENLVLAGTLGPSQSPFFFVSGTHDKGFPWGDGEIFWDVMLAVAEPGGGWIRYGITDRVLEGLELDIATGRYRYRGPVFRLPESGKASWSQMRRKPATLVECQADIFIDFDARAHDAVPFPFPLIPDRLRALSSAAAKQIREALPGEHPLGIQITPHTISVRRGTLAIHESGRQSQWALDPSAVYGEGERGSFRNVKKPAALYHYLCALDPGRSATRVQITTGALRDERQHWTKDAIDKLVGFTVSRTACAQIGIETGKLSVRPLAPSGGANLAVPLCKKGTPIIELNNDQFPTGIFQRRIVEVEDSAGWRSLALEEDMSLLRLEAVNSSRTARVAAIRASDKFAALDAVLEATGFDALLDAKLAASGRNRADFAVVIKPNFMFAYNKRDCSTFTDPELVHHLVLRIRARGFVKVQVAEAQSTYGEYFDHRGVKDVAAYLGYDGAAGYEVVDMTLDATESRDMGPHLGVHPYSRAWSEAGFRVSFAKNKTHAYSYYTLTLKNIYGALPLANKFKEYHCGRGIYHTAIDYLKAFPVDYGLVDGWSSADGPFGIFADTAPNFTETIIGGPDLVAVDWVAASKMGLDPMVSPYMQIAVEEIGKPQIDFTGDPNPYYPWLNVPAELTVLTHKGMDAEYNFGNLLYSISSEMDSTYFHHKDNSWLVRGLRELTVPIRRAFFVRTGENPTALNRFFSWLFYKMGE